jgi:hypothetical protein
VRGHASEILGLSFAKGSVESTHKVPTSHDHTKHRRQTGAVTAVASLFVNSETRHREIFGKIAFPIEGFFLLAALA